MKMMGALKVSSLLIWLVAIFSLSLFSGLMIATAGGALYTPIYGIAAPYTCDGEFSIESTGYSYKPGQSGVEHHIYCDDSASGTRTEITLSVVFVASLAYSGMIFAALLVISLILIIPVLYFARRKKSTVGTGSLSHTGSPAAGASIRSSRFIVNGQEYASLDEMPGDARAAYGQAMGVLADSDRNGVPDVLAGMGQGERTSGDIAERLLKLKGLVEEGLISEQEYQAKKAEILSEL